MPTKQRPRLTSEQRAGVEATLALVKSGKGGAVKIAAGAGTGKTATLRSIAAHLRQIGLKPSEILYLAFNRGIKEEAKVKFAKLATVRTVHGLAYQALELYNATRPIGSLYPRQVKELLNIGDKAPGNVNGWDAARGVLETLKVFMNSEELDVRDQHIPEVVRHQSRDPFYLAWVLQKANDLFSRITPDRDDTELPIPFDCYVKFWQCVGSPSLDRFKVVLLDEVQDISAVTLASLKENPTTPVVFVGDSAQQIYRYRQTIDAFRLIEGETLALSQSWRFGERIASLSNRILREKTEPALFEIKGNPALDTVIGRLDPSKPYAHLFRTNFGLLGEAIDLMAKDVPFEIVGDLSDLKQRVESSWGLFTSDRKKVRHPLISMFKSWRDMEQMAEQGSDPEIGQCVKVIRELGGQIDLVRDLLSGKLNKPGGVILSTAHRAKGLEWNQVKIAEDFDQRLTTDDFMDPDSWDDEMNLLYVAITRAQGVLESDSVFVDNLWFEVQKEQLTAKAS